MHQIIHDQKIYTKALNRAFDSWETQRNPEVHNQQDEPKVKETAKIDSENNVNNINISNNIEKEDDCLVCIKSDLKFIDPSMPEQEKVAENISTAIRTIVSGFVQKYNGRNKNENKGITMIDFAKLHDATKFAVEYLKDIGEFLDKNGSEGFVLRNCCVIAKNLYNEVLLYQSDSTKFLMKIQMI